MSSSDLLSSTLNWPGKGLYGLKSSVLQTTENNLVKQKIVSDHMKNHYRRLHSARSAVDSKPPKAMILGQKSRDRARKEVAQMAYTQNVLDQYSGGSLRATPRARSTQSARSRRIVQSQPTTYRARSRSIESSRMITRSLNMNGSTQNLNQNDGGDIASKLFGDGVLTQALTSMAALGKLTSSARNKGSADVLDKHPDFFSQPNPDEHQPRLVKRDGPSSLRENRKYYNPPTKSKARPLSASRRQFKTQDVVPNEAQQKEDEQLALREQLNKSLELRQNVEKKIKKAKATTTANPPNRKQSDEVLKRYHLSENERLEYVRFMQEITDAIIRNNLTTESAIERLFEIHIDRNRQTLDERRLRGLLEALKEDLGVRTSRKADTYASVHKATTYDNEPLPPQASTNTREYSSVSTPKPSYDDKRRPSYDVNAPLPWESDHELDKQPTVTQRSTYESKRNSVSTDRPNPLDDDHLFSPISTTTTTIKPKPRQSLQAKTDDPHNSDDPSHARLTEPEPTNFNTTMRKPANDLHNFDWMTDSQPAKTTVEKHSLHHVREENDDVDEGGGAHERQDPSPQLKNHSESELYVSNDFEDHANESDDYEQ